MSDIKGYKQETVTFEEEPGVIYDVIAIFPVKIDNNTEHDYIALLKRGADPDEDILLYRADMTDPDNIGVIAIEDDDEYEIVADEFDEMLDEQEFFDLVDDLDEEDDEEED